MLKYRSHDAWLEGADSNGILVPSSSGDYPRQPESVGQCGVSLEYIRLLLAHSIRVLTEESTTLDFVNDVVIPLTKKKHRCEESVSSSNHAIILAISTSTVHCHMDGIHVHRARFDACCAVKRFRYISTTQYISTPMDTKLTGTFRFFDMLPREYTGQPSFYVVHAWGGPFLAMLEQVLHHLTPPGT